MKKSPEKRIEEAKAKMKQIAESQSIDQLKDLAKKLMDDYRPGTDAVLTVILDELGTRIEKEELYAFVFSL